MGTSKRYAEHFDKLTDQRILERVAASGELQSLSDAETGIRQEPMTRDPQPKPARVWVRFGTTPVIVDAEVCAWTTNAIGIRFDVAGTQHKTWVWASAALPAPARA